MDVHFDSNQVSVTAKNSLNKIKTFQAKYVVGCDGANSTTRKKVDIEFETLASPQQKNQELNREWYIKYLLIALLTNQDRLIPTND